MDPSQLSPKFIILMILMAGAACVLFYFSSNGKKLNRIKATEVGDGQHGNDRFMTYKEARELYTPVKIPTEIKDMTGQIPAGRILHFNEKTREALVDTSMTHLKMAAPTESMKTTTYVIPNLQYNIMAGQYNMIVPDIKGELFALTAADAERCGYKVYKLNFIDPEDSDLIDYFEDIINYWDHYQKHGDLMSKVKAEDAAGELAWDIVSSREHSDSENPFFEKASKGVIHTLILLLIMFGNDSQKHIGSISNIVQGMLKAPRDAKNKEPKILKIMDKLPDDLGAKKYLGAAWAAAEETEANIYASVLGDLEPFINGIAEQIIAKPHIKEKQFSYKKLIEEKCIVYIIIPETKEQFKVFGTTIIKKLYNPLMEYASKQPNNKLPITIYLPWEEMALYSKVYNVDDWLSIMRGRGMLTDLIYQDKSQLVKKYDENIMKILSNQCATSIYLAFAPDDIDTAEQLSKSLGSKTIKTGSVSINHDASKNTFFSSTSKSETEQMMERPLMTPSEILHMGKDNIKLLLRRNQYPFKTSLTPYFTDAWGLSPSKETLQRKQNNFTKIDYMSYDELLKKIDDYVYDLNQITINNITIKKDPVIKKDEKLFTLDITNPEIPSENTQKNSAYIEIAKKLMDLTNDPKTVELLNEERYPELIKYMQKYRRVISPFDLQKLLEPLAE